MGTPKLILRKNISDMKKNLVIVNANDPQLANLIPYLNSLFCPDRGNFKGDVYVITTGMSEVVKNKLADLGAKIFENTLTEVLSSEFSLRIGAYEILKRKFNKRTTWKRILKRTTSILFFRKLVESSILSMKNELNRMIEKAERDLSYRAVLEAEFELYHRKHFTKLNAIHLWKTIDVERYSSVLLTDADMIFQNDVSSIFKKIEESEYFVYEDESVPLLRCPQDQEGYIHLSSSHRLAEETKYSKMLKFGDGFAECNVGVVGIKAARFMEWILDWKSLMWDEEMNFLFTAHPKLFWHEQDFFRLQRDLHISETTKFGKELVYHAVGAMGYEIEEVDLNTFRTKSSKIEPTLVHFAGGSWKRFENINKEYSKNISELIKS